MPEQLASALQAEVDRFAESSPVSAAVVTPAGVWAAAAGTPAEGFPLSPQTSLGIAEVTATFTAAEVMYLAERGRVDLDAPLSEYVRSPLTGGGATVRQALSMTSGIPDCLQWDRLVAEPDRRWTPPQYLALCRDQPGEPGAAFGASHANLALLGMLIEEVTDRSYAASLHADLLDGAGLSAVAVQDTDRPAEPVVRAPKDLRGSSAYVPNRAVSSAFAAAVGIATTATLTARWGYELYGGRILAPETVAAMIPAEDVERLAFGQYGLGTVATSLPGDRLVVGHEGWMPGYSAILYVSRDPAASVAVLVPDGRPAIPVDRLALTLLNLAV